MPPHIRRRAHVVRPAGYGQRLIWLRERVGLNQAQCAERLGVFPGNLSLWETERALPQGRTFKRLATFFGVTAYWIQWGKNPPADSGEARGVYQALPEQATEWVQSQHERVIGGDKP